MSFITTDLALAILDLQSGKPVAIPTETVYGLAALINNPKAIQTIFTMKNRPLNHPLIVHVAQDWDLASIVDNIPEYAQTLMQKFWPGSLTLVFQAKKDQVHPSISGGQNTVAIRCPDHSLTQQLLKKLGCPVVAPSANPFGKISPTTALHVKQAFPEVELTILDGGRCPIGIESTIVDASHNDHYQILRHGLIDEKAISKAISTPYSPHKKSTIRVSGSLDRHYQPQKKLYYFDHYEQLERFCENRAGQVYALANKRPATVAPEQFHLLPSQPQEFAFDLYYQLREADASSVACIAIELPPNSSEWQGVRERILKAGSVFEM